MFSFTFKHQNKTTLSLWILVALLLFVPIAKNQHLAEHNFLSEQTDIIHDDCKTCHSSALQEVDNYHATLSIIKINLIEQIIVGATSLFHSENLFYFSSRAPPYHFQ